MSHPAVSSPPTHSRLIRYLSELAVLDAAGAARDFGERLGLLLDFSNSILLADALKPTAASTATAEFPDAADIRKTFLQARGQLVAGMVSSCTPGASARIKWPELSPDGDRMEPLHRFYLAHQRDMELGVRALRTTVREALRDADPRLQQLARLDAVLEDSLWDHSRRFLALIPRYLERRISMRQQQAASGNPDSLHLALRKDIQGLLLAELELRLQPVLGLVETLGERID